jgi:arylsulfotransferase ASST
VSRVEQIKLKRAGIGLRACDPARACPGYTLFAPMCGDGTVYLIDLQGEVVHTWSMPYPPGLYGYLTARGTLFYNGRTPDPHSDGQHEIPWKGGAAMEVDWDGRVLWEVRHPDHHHDGIRLRSGNVLLLCEAIMPRELVPRVRGGLSGTEDNGNMWADYLVEMTTEGEVVWEWRSWEHLDPEADGITAQQHRRDAWTHGNAVTEMPDESLLVSFRNISTLVIVERATGRILWKLGPPVLAQQHAPTALPNGHILIFDNGTHRADHPVPFSRVIEVEPSTKEIVWSYQERRLIDFFSPFISNAQRLPNGNTLICEGNFGRLFEVTPEGELVWEYVNPHFPVPSPDEAPNNSVFRAFRYSPEEIEGARGTSREA